MLWLSFNLALQVGVMLRALNVADVTQIMQGLQSSVVKITFNCGYVVEHFFANDDHFRLNQSQAVQQNFATLTGVDHRGNSAKLYDSQNSDQGFRAVFQDNRDNVTTADAF